MKKILLYFLISSLTYSAFTFSVSAESLNNSDMTAESALEPDYSLQDSDDGTVDSVSEIESESSDASLIEVDNTDEKSNISYSFETNLEDNSEANTETNSDELIVDEDAAIEENNSLALSNDEPTAPTTIITKDSIQYYIISDINQWNYVGQQRGDWLKYNYALGADLVINSDALTCDENGNLQNNPSNLVEIIPWDGFEGIFDGQEHTISGLYLNEASSGVGLFTGCTGDILNLKVTNAYVKGFDEVGGICSTFTKVGGNFKNNSFEGTVCGKSTVGGLIGSSDCSNISGCINKGNVWSSEGSVGGITGRFSAYGIYNCINEGSIHAKGDCVGGITSSSDIYEVGSCKNKGSIEGRNYVGGIIGRISNQASISNCGNTGTVTGQDYVGGIVGTAAKDIYTNSISKCYNSSPINGDGYVGGIIGYAELANVLSDNNVGSVTGNSNVGAVCGASEAIWGNGNISDCIFLSTNSINNQLQGIGNGTVSSDEIKAISDDTYCDIDTDGKILFHEESRKDAVNATCTCDGATGILICIRCGKILDESHPIKAKGHFWNAEITIDREATCTKTGQKSIHCSVCGAVKKGSEEEIPALGHNFGEWHIVRAATTNAEGLEERTCKKNDATEQRSIPKLPASPTSTQPAIPLQPETAATPVPIASALNITIHKVPASVKAKAVAKGKVIVSWKKIKKTKKTTNLLKQIKKVQIQYGTNKTSGLRTRIVSGKKTSVALKLAKKKMYYIRVRYSDGKGGYSKWSGWKKVRTKK